MILAALLDLGVPLKEIELQLKTLGLPPFQFEVNQVKRNGIHCKQCAVLVPSEHKHRHLSDIIQIINKSNVSNSVKEKSILIFKRIAIAEARVHGIDVEEVHFHEVGALDSMIDVVSCCVGFDLLGIDEFYCGELSVGNGIIQCAHGTLPDPAPATAELIKGFSVRVLDTKTEILTPTGAAIITTLAKQRLLSSFEMEKIGYGSGKKEIQNFPNFLRLWLGKTTKTDETDRILLLETNLDNCTAEILGFTMERLFTAGALDVFFTPVFGKKNRPATLISVIAPIEKREAVTSVLFTETSTLGIRFREMDRAKLCRESLEIDSPWGRMRVKKIEGLRTSQYAPEYEECKRIAEEKRIPLRDIYSWVLAQNQ